MRTPWEYHEESPMRATIMAPSYIVSLVIVLSQVLPMFNIHVGSDALTTTIQTGIAIFGGLFVMLRQITTKRSTLVGTRPS